MMYHTGGWINGWMGGHVWVWSPIGALIVILLAVLIFKVAKRKTSP